LGGIKSFVQPFDFPAWILKPVGTPDPVDFPAQPFQDLLAQAVTVAGR
jgi:hypothetical protein